MKIFITLNMPLFHEHKDTMSLDAASIQALTPLMQQYVEIKNQYADALVLFQVGDFYELFYDDAKKAAACLAIALTARGKNNGEPIPLCGVPVHAVNHYLAKLVAAGFKVVLCNQLEPATPGKVVARGVTQVFTPGTLTDSALLDEKKPSYLFSFFPGTTAHALLFGELLTAQLWGTIIAVKSTYHIETEVQRFMPDEILLPSIKEAKEFETYFKKLGYYTTLIARENETDARASQWIAQLNFAKKNTGNHHDSIYNALAQFHSYIKNSHAASLDQFQTLELYQAQEFLSIDSATQRNLELVKNMHDGSVKNSLFQVMDGAVTAMGSRTIKKWIARPLIDRDAIVQRHDAVEHFVYNVSFLQKIRTLLQRVGDAERIIGRIIVLRGSIHDYRSLLTILETLPPFSVCLSDVALPVLLRMIGSMTQQADMLFNYLKKALYCDSSQEWLIASNFDAQLDAYRLLVEKSTHVLLEFEKREQARTGISSLKVRFNSVHGYYIEITHANAHLVPADYIRTQTLVGKERYTTIELRKLEVEVNEARANINQLETTIFARVKAEVHAHASTLRRIARALSHLDALFGLAYISYSHGFIRPTFNDATTVNIKQGKHPVVSTQMNSHFIPNDTVLDDEQSLWIITGPNMGGKSTYLRQVALISIMAQCGSFVPAAHADLPIFDKIFSRIGAGDNVAAGKSTFLMEMEETAFICAHATHKSLVIFDEIGRGTSTFDGLALAQAVLEYVHTMIRARCLFATHYHELTALAQRLKGIVCYHAASKKTATGISLLYAIVPGSADGSFGIEVAKIARVPDMVIRRAQEIVTELGMHAPSLYKESVPSAPLPDARAQELYALVQQLDYENLSPKHAFDILWAMKEMVEKK